MKARLYKKGWIGAGLWKIYLVDHLPDNEENHGVTIPHLQTIYILESTLRTPGMFEDTVYHEIKHAAYSQFGIDPKRISKEDFEESWVRATTAAELAALKGFGMLPRIIKP